MDFFLQAVPEQDGSKQPPQAVDEETSLSLSSLQLLKERRLLLRHPPPLPLDREARGAKLGDQGPHVRLYRQPDGGDAGSFAPEAGEEEKLRLAAQPDELTADEESTALDHEPDAAEGQGRIILVLHESSCLAVDEHHVVVGDVWVDGLEHSSQLVHLREVPQALARVKQELQHPANLSLLLLVQHQQASQEREGLERLAGLLCSLQHLALHLLPH
mmetsp:Transcript_19421/g.44477  ORF Transcript_19421/g.44477 Transcript_19421/m.44477 type:complete len:216 (+) Transcript_19421:413-1060(+)